MHLKRIKAPKFWKIPRKELTWTVSTRPGPHKKLESIPLQILIRDILNIVDIAKDVRKIVNKENILIDGKIRKDYAYGVGLFDVISIPKLKKNYRVVPTSKFRSVIEISDQESKKKICKIINKTTIQNGKTQLNLHDGKNILIDDKKYKTGDTIIIEIPSMKIIDHIPLEKGVVGIITKGNQAGLIGTLKEIKKASSREAANVICEFDGNKQTILKDRFFVVGKTKPVIKIGE